MRVTKATVLLVLIVSLALFLRVYKLADIPNGLKHDESAIGYNAYAILTTGKDEYGTPYPVYFKSFGDQKLPVYIYLTALSVGVFGLNEFAVRFPSAVLGSLTVLLLYLVVKRLSNNSGLALVSAFLLAITPWHILFSRAAFETNAALAFVMVGVWLFLLGITTKHWLYLFLSVSGFVLALYSYNVTRLLSPALLAGLLWLHWKPVRHIPRKTLVSLGIFGFLGLLPFLLTFFSAAGASSAQHALLTSTDIQAKNLEMRSYLAQSAPLLGKVFFNNYIFMGWQYLENLVSVFSPDFFFISGRAAGSRWVGEMGQLYLLQFPLIILGLVFLLREKGRSGLSFFLLWTVVTILVVGLSKEVPHATRGYFLIIPLTVFAAQGFLLLFAWLRGMRHRRLRSLIAVFLFCVCFYNIVYYFSAFYFRFPNKYAKDWNQQDKALALYLKANAAKYDTIIIDHGAGFMYTSLLFFTAYDPNEFQKFAKRTADDVEGFSRVSALGKYQWRDIQWKRDLRRKNTLIVTGFNKAPASAHVVKRFRYPQVPIVLSVKEQIAQYPWQEEAYVLVATPDKPVPKVRPQPQPAVGH